RFCNSHSSPLPLTSFPTRRSSDLGGLAFDWDRVANGPHVLPAAAILVLVRVHRVRVVDVQVFVVGSEYGEPPRTVLVVADRDARSEEHTSELQSHLNLVCRLLLEK